MNNLIAFIRDAFTELRTKVTWPKFSDLRSSSTLVIVASLIFALVIALVDLSFENIMNWFYSSF